MKEQNPRSTNSIQLKEAHWASFFKIDPENWPDLPPPEIKPNQYWKPSLRWRSRFYRRISSFSNPIQAIPTEEPIPSGWKIPQSELDKELVAKRAEERRIKVLKMQVRVQATELVHKYKSGEVRIDQVEDFYLNHAENLVNYKPYLAYCEYTQQTKQGAMDWPEYAKLMVLEVFTNDLTPIILSKHSVRQSKSKNLIRNLRKLVWF